MKIGILALQGNVIEHKRALVAAAKNLGLEIEIVMVRKLEDLDGLSGIILPGGESTTISLLLEKFGMLEKLAAVPAIFGTCAGLILMAKKANGAEEGQKGLGLMDVTISRNAYGSQIDSFEGVLDWELFSGEKICFIRAPKILKVEEGVTVLAKLIGTEEIAIVEQEKNGQYLLGATCHPELTTSKMSEYFLKKIKKN